MNTQTYNHRNTLNQGSTERVIQLNFFVYFVNSPSEHFIHHFILFFPQLRERLFHHLISICITSHHMFRKSKQKQKYDFLLIALAELANFLCVGQRILRCMCCVHSAGSLPEGSPLTHSLAALLSSDGLKNEKKYTGSVRTQSTCSEDKLWRHRKPKNIKKKPPYDV